MKLIAEIATYSINTTAEFTVKMICSLTLSSYKLDTSYNYTIMDSDKSISFNELSYQTKCTDLSIIYSAKMQDGNSLSSFISFNSVTRSFEVETSSNTNYGQYYIVLIATLQDSSLTSNDSFMWTLMVNLYENTTKEEEFNNTAPYFLSEPTDFDIIPGSEFEYTLPEAIDAENDTIFYTVDLGTAYSFTEYEDMTFSFAPLPKHLGEHDVKITLKDSAAKALSNIYAFTVFVSDSDLDEELREKYDREKNEYERFMTSFKAIVREIDMLGQLKLQFFDDWTYN